MGPRGGGGMMAVGINIFFLGSGEARQPWREDGLVSIVFKLIPYALLMIEIEEL